MLEKRLVRRSFCYASAPPGLGDRKVPRRELPCAPALASASSRSRRTLLGQPPGEDPGHPGADPAEDLVRNRSGRAGEVPRGHAAPGVRPEAHDTVPGDAPQPVASTSVRSMLTAP